MQNDFEEHVVPVLFYFAENDRGANSLYFLHIEAGWKVQSLCEEQSNLTASSGYPSA